MARLGARRFRLARPSGQQLGLQDLVDAGAGQEVEEADLPRDLVAGKAGAAVGEEVLGPGDGARPEDDPGAANLAPSLVRHADHGGLGHTGVLVEGGFDLGGIDVLAAGDEHVLQPVEDAAEALLVALDDVAGAEPLAVEGLLGHAFIPSYCASKAGLIGLTRSLADYLGPKGIRANAVCPGYIDTPMLNADDNMKAGYTASTVLRRMGQPADIAGAVRFLLSEDASFITGQAIAVDGGVTAVDRPFGT